MLRSRTLVVVGIFLAVIVLVPSLRAPISIIAFSIVYAFLTSPLARLLGRRLPRALSVAFANVGVAVLLAIAAMVSGPFVYVQLQSLLSEMPQALGAAARSLPATINDQILAVFSAGNGSAISMLRDTLLTGYGVARSALGIAAAVVLVPVLAAYLQYDAPRYYTAALKFIPKERHAAFDTFLQRTSTVFGTFIRAQLLVSGIVGVLVYIALAVAGVPFALPIAILTAVADLVPYLGGIAAFVPSIVLALAIGGIWKALLVGVLLIVVFEVEAQVLQPQLVGSRTHLPSSVVVVALLLGGGLFGALGLYLAVPVAAALPALWELAEERDDQRVSQTRLVG
jgi:predicted PurR-regulated permease PerM